VDEPIHLELTHDEALVLFELLSRYTNSHEPLEFCDPAEEQALCNLQCLLEKQLTEPFLPNYSSLLENARAQLRRSDS
jgi:hypothetical protein